MDNEIKRLLEEIKAGMQCPKEFRCVDSGYEKLCNAKDMGLERYLECHEKDAAACSFAIAFGKEYFCRCQMRVFIAKRLHR